MSWQDIIKGKGERHFYIENGKPVQWIGETHKHPDGTLMSGKEHKEGVSKKLLHFYELDEKHLKHLSKETTVIKWEELLKFKRRFKKVVTNKKTGRKKTVKYGQAGKAKDGGDRIRPGTSKGDAYCARSNKIKGDWRSDPNSPNNLSRKKWKCHGNKSSK